MQSAVPSFWDSMLEVPTSGLGPRFFASEAPALGDGHITIDAGLQFVTSFLHEPDHAGLQLGLVGSACGSGLDQLPTIDESLFDLVEVPELEEVEDELNESADSNPAPPACQPLFDEIPALEDILDEDVNWPSWASEPSQDSSTVSARVAVEPTAVTTAPALLSLTSPKRELVSPKLEQQQEDERWSARSVQTASPQLTTSTILFEDNGPAVNGYEEVVAGLPNYADSCVGSASPASVYSQACSISSSSGIGGSSPLSCGFTSADDMAAMSPAEKRRRISQVSVSSFCSSVGTADSIGSPASPTSGVTSDSDHGTERKRGGRAGTGGGRRSRFTPEDRKERKKAQNRTAAERYRQKRRLAEETTTEEEQELLDANGVLRIEVTKLEAEVSCLKRLMREMLKAKGIEIPPPPKKKTKTS